MHPDLLADENIDRRIIEKLREAGFKVLSIGENYSGIKDNEILSLAKLNRSVVITEDKDFGELIFSHNEANVGIILLRYDYTERVSITKSLIYILQKYKFTLQNKFTVITPKKVRIREI